MENGGQEEARVEWLLQEEVSISQLVEPADRKVPFYVM